MGHLKQTDAGAEGPVTIVVPWAFGALSRMLDGPGGFLLGKLLVAGAIVFLMTYAIMPHYTRLVATWLYR